MNNKILYLATILLILSVFYFGQGCNIFSPASTPTPVPTNTPPPTSTPVPTPTEDPKAYLIEPGKGIAYIEINKSDLNSVKKWLGKKGKETTEKDFIKLIYENDKLTFWFASNKQLLKVISIENNSYKTSEEIGLGSTVFKAQEIYPKGFLDLEKRVYFCEDGTDYYYDGTGEITKIYISDRKSLPTPVPTQTHAQKIANLSYEDIANEVVDLFINEDFKGILKYIKPSAVIEGDEDIEASMKAGKVLGYYSTTRLKNLWELNNSLNGSIQKRLEVEEIIETKDDFIVVHIKCACEKKDIDLEIILDKEKEVVGFYGYKTVFKDN